MTRPPPSESTAKSAERAAIGFALARLKIGPGVGFSTAFDSSKAITAVLIPITA